MAKPDTRRLVCAACKHENEVERVYCHGCGEKLDRSLLPQIEPEKEDEKREKEGRKVRRMMNPNRLSWWQSTKRAVGIVSLAAAVAAVFLAVRPPEDVPPAKMDRLPEQEVGDTWSAMMMHRPATAVTMKEYDVNYFLNRAVKGADGQFGIKFVRAFANFQPGSTTATVERNAWGLPLFNSVRFEAVPGDEKWMAKVTGIYMGRLAIHPKLAQLAPLTLNALSKAFEKQIKEAGRLSTITPGQDSITLVTKPSN